ncbi:MAG: pyridoxamine 5'-phosphate oxidase family protein [bacterium]
MEREFSQQELEHVIAEFMENHATCVLATCLDDVPRASTVEFFPDGLTIYILTEGGKKIENIRKNPHVALAVSGPYTGWESVRGLQITGNAEIGSKGSDIFHKGQEAYRRRRKQEHAVVPGSMQVIRIVPDTIEYLDTSLGQRGLPIRHVLRCQGPPS